MAKSVSRMFGCERPRARKQWHDIAVAMRFLRVQTQRCQATDNVQGTAMPLRFGGVHRSLPPGLLCPQPLAQALVVAIGETVIY